MNTTTGPREDSVDDTALRALRLFQTGQPEVGLQMYCTLFQDRRAVDIPVGLHARMLEAEGWSDAAQTIVRRALQAGWDIGCRLGPETARRQEYEAFFASGRANARMVANYLLLLDRMGDGNAMRPWTALDPLLQQCMLPADGLSPDLIDAAADTLGTMARPLAPERENRSVRDLRRIVDTHLSPNPVLKELHGAVTATALAYVRLLQDAGHPYARLRDGDLTPYSWGVVSDGVGHNVPHHHGDAFVVAVAYLRVPDLAEEAGNYRLHLGAPEEAIDPTRWEAASIRPRPGQIVLMPGYFCHWTRPYPGGGSRISLAVNYRARATGDVMADMCTALTGAAMHRS